MAKVFVSYAHEDRSAAHQIARALTDAKLEPWLDVQEIRIGDELLKTIATVLAEVDYYAVVLTRTALTKRWVLAEMRMAITADINEGHPKVIALRLDDCELPLDIQSRIHLDFRGRFEAALAELVAHVRGIAPSVSVPKQTVLAEMIKGADTEWWARLSAGGGSRDELKQTEAADAIRDLRAEDLEAAVAIGSRWKDYKQWEDGLLDTIRRAADVGDVGARRILKRLVDAGFLVQADDLDYRETSDNAWCDGSMLWILHRAARRSGLFPALPPPLPDRLSTLLAYVHPLNIFATGWFAVRFRHPIATALDANQTISVVVVRHVAPGRTWAFRSADDRAPLITEQGLSLTELTPADPFASSGQGIEQEHLGFDLVTFDDVGLLRG